MSDLSTRWLGIPIANPLIVGADRLTADMGVIKRIEEAGAAAIVTASLFEEQIELQNDLLEDFALGLRQPRTAGTFRSRGDVLRRPRGAPRLGEASGAEAVSIPLFASLNARTHDVWLDWSERLAETGVDGLGSISTRRPAIPSFGRSHRGRTGHAREGDLHACIAASGRRKNVSVFDESAQPGRAPCEGRRARRRLLQPLFSARPRSRNGRERLHVRPERRNGEPPAAAIHRARKRTDRRRYLRLDGDLLGLRRREDDPRGGFGRTGRQRALQEEAVRPRSDTKKSCISGWTWRGMRPWRMPWAGRMRFTARIPMRGNGPNTSGSSWGRERASDSTRFCKTGKGYLMGGEERGTGEERTHGGRTAARGEEILLRLVARPSCLLPREEPLIDDDEFGDLLKEKDE